MHAVNNALIHMPTHAQLLTLNTPLNYAQVDSYIVNTSARGQHSDRPAHLCHSI